MIEDTTDIFVAVQNEEIIDKTDHVTRDVITPPTGMNTLPTAPQEGEVDADVLNAEEDASDMFVDSPEEQNINEADKLPGYVPMVSIGLEDPNSVPSRKEDGTEVSKGLNNPASITPEEGLACPVTNCGFVTPLKVPDNVEKEYKMRLMQLQMQELKIHVVDVHGIEVDGQDCVQQGMGVNAEVVHVGSDALTRTVQKDQLRDSFVGDRTDITAATIAELEDATGTTVPKGWSKSSSRSKKSKQRKKSRRLL